MMKEPEKHFLHAFTSTFSKWIGSHHDSVMKQTKMAALAMLPSWDELASEHEDRRAERLLEKVDQVCFCVKNCFLNEDLKTDTRAMSEVCYTMLRNYYIKVVSSFQYGSGQFVLHKDLGLKVDLSAIPKKDKIY